MGLRPRSRGPVLVQLTAVRGQHMRGQHKDAAKKCTAVCGNLAIPRKESDTPSPGIPSHASLGHIVAIMTFDTAVALLAVSCAAACALAAALAAASAQAPEVRTMRKYE